VNLDSALAQALGREPSAQERQMLAGLMAAFEVRDNDGILPVLATLMRIDAAYRPVPERLMQLLEKYEGAIEQRCSASLAPPGRSTRDRPRELRWLTVGGLLTTGTVLFAAGAAVGAAAFAVWTSPPQAAALARIAAWLVVPVVAAYGGAWGWEVAHQLYRPVLQRWGGWAMLVGSGAGVALWVLSLGR
jgi:hypothetical protein